MNYIFKIFASVLLASIIMVSPAKVFADTTARATKVTILHTNDNHGRFWKNRRGEYGMSARKTLIDKIRKEKEAQGSVVLVLSGGDINTGVPESDIQDAEPDFVGMKAIGYDAMAIGNHEFDNPMEVLKKQQSWVDFPFLSANIYDEKTGKRLFQPYKIFNRKGLKIAVLGLTTDDTARVGNPEYLAGIEFRSPVEEAKKLVPELRKKADIVIAITHMGHYQNGNRGINAPGDVAMARAVDGIDVIIGGHSQNPVCMDLNAINQYDKKFKPGKSCVPDWQNGTWIMQAYEWGKYVGQADLTLSNNGIKLDNYALIPINLKVKKKDANGKTVKNAKGKTVRVYATQEIAEDESLKALLTPYQEKGQAGLSVVLGKTDGKLEGDRKKVRFVPTNLGYLIAEAQRSKVNADVAVMNSGGIRDSIKKGDITYKDILKTQPFGNTVCSIQLKGKDLKEYLEFAASQPIDSGTFAQFAGVDIVIKDNKLISVTVAGKEIAPDRNYKLALNSFLASGGDGYPKMTGRPGFINTGFVDADVLREFIEAKSPIVAADYAPTNVKRD